MRKVHVVKATCWVQWRYPRFGIACLGKVNAAFENDMDLMIQFYRFIANWQLAHDVKELSDDRKMARSE
ncbi:hypothetical protein KSP40_PGU003527 [Platanthera guangdongensis]|uniref:Uncharacterized protein n=1 Tax=Platanthera guangdongensis TaxID=2320717 RepID=A0ABR2LEE4_9ASPA